MVPVIISVIIHMCVILTKENKDQIFLYYKNIVSIRKGSKSPLMLQNNIFQVPRKVNLPLMYSLCICFSVCLFVYWKAE